MLDVLEGKNLYSRCHCQPFGVDRRHRLSGAPDGSYDLVVICGAFGYGHLPADAVEEAARLVRKGGIFVNVMVQIDETR